MGIFFGDHNHTMVIIGDSFVRGTGATSRNGWAQMLSESFSSFYQVYINGHGGHTIEDVLDRLDSDVFDHCPDLIILQVGLNDSRYRPSFETNHEVPPDKYKSGVNDFITRARSCCYPHTSVVILGTTPVDEQKTRPYKEDKHYINSNSSVYDSILSDICRDRHTRYINLFDVFKEKNLEEVLEDGVHPNDNGHQLIYDNVSKHLSTNHVP